MYNLIFRGPAKKFIKKLDKKEQKDILNKIKKLKSNPELGKRLSGNLYGLWKLRFDKYRIIYQIIQDKLIIIVLDIDHRKRVY